MRLSNAVMRNPILPDSNSRVHIAKSTGKEDGRIPCVNLLDNQILWMNGLIFNVKPRFH
jgi:hypothetical protein